MNPARLALTSALLGPALLLGGDPVIWGALLLLPLNALILAAWWGEACTGSRRGVLLVVALLVFLPLQVAVLDRLCLVTGLAHGLPVLELTLVLFCHLCAYQVLHSSGDLPRRERRQRGVRAAFWLLPSLAGLFMAGRLEALLEQVLQHLGAGFGAALPGFPRLVLAAVVLALLQKRWDRRDQATHVRKDA